MTNSSFIQSLPSLYRKVIERDYHYVKTEIRKIAMAKVHPTDKVGILQTCLFLAACNGDDRIQSLLCREGGCPLSLHCRLDPTALDIIKALFEEPIFKQMLDSVGKKCLGMGLEAAEEQKASSIIKYLTKKIANILASYEKEFLESDAHWRLMWGEGKCDSGDLEEFAGDSSYYAHLFLDYAKSLASILVKKGEKK